MSQSLAFVFPGQGSQQVGMLSELSSSYGIIKETFQEASDALGFDLWEMVQRGPEDALNSTENTQPALLAASVALWRLWHQEGGQAPATLAGHSLGEYSALVCADAISFADGIRLVNLRGQFMQQAVPPGTGAMAAILGLEDAVVEAACAAVAGDDVVAPVNYNCPGQIVIAGERAAVDRAMAACKEAGAKRALPLSVSVPSHCRLMKPAAEQMAEIIAAIEIRLPSISVIQNVNAARPVTTEELTHNLLSQLYSPVLWTRSVEYMVAEGVTQVIECGPGKVLSGLNKKIDKALEVASIGDAAGFEKALNL